jgi:hypothetical protein
MKKEGQVDRVAAVAFCGIAIIGFLALVWSLGSLTGREAERRLTSSHKHGLDAKGSAIRLCSTRTDDQRLECLYEAVKAAEETALTEQDLTAQQRAAWGAMIAAVCAFISIPIGIGGLWAVVRSLKHTERAISVSMASMDETRKANDQYRKQSRAVLYTSDLIFSLDYIDGDKNLVCTARFKIENVGDTPAHRVAIKLGLHLLNKRKRIAAASKSHHIGVIKAASKSEREVIFIVKDRAVFDQNINKFSRALITFERTYVDVFDERTTEHYAMISSVSSGAEEKFLAEDFTFCDRSFVARIKDVPLRRT